MFIWFYQWLPWPPAPWQIVNKCQCLYRAQPELFYQQIWSDSNHCWHGQTTEELNHRQGEQINIGNVTVAWLVLAGPWSFPKTAKTASLDPSLDSISTKSNSIKWSLAAGGGRPDPEQALPALPAPGLTDTQASSTFIYSSPCNGKILG